MSRKKFTARFIESRKPPASGRAEYWDEVLRGFGLRITSRGTRSWFIMYRAGGVQRRLKIGAYPALSLADARDEASTAFQAIGKGHDPAAEKQAARATGNTVEAIVDAYMTKHAARFQKRPEATHWYLKKYVLPKWSGRAIASITRWDVSALLDNLVTRGRGPTANRVFDTLRAFFNWCVGKGLLDVSPCAGINAPAKKVSRDRVLKDAEIVALWDAWGDQGFPFGPMCRLLLVTGQRRGEVASMRWADLDLENRLWTLPREQTKSDRAHDVPLSELAIGILDGMPRSDDDVFVFTTKRRRTRDADGGAAARPVSGFSGAKRRSDELAEVTDWRLHDLRRTATTNMAIMGAPIHVLAAVLNHSPGAVAGVTAIYNRHAYADEKRQVLEEWGRRLESLIDGLEAKVIDLPSAALGRERGQ